MSDGLKQEPDDQIRSREAGGWAAWPHRWLADGRLLSLEPLVFNAYRLHVVVDARSTASTDIYDFQDGVAAVAALAEWDGEREPAGWYRHRPSNRRRPDGDPAREYVAP